MAWPPALRNLAGGFAATAWSLSIGLLAVPVYLQWLGPQGYALIALHMTLQAVLQTLDGALTATTTREVAARGHDATTSQRLNAIGWLAWGCAALIALGLLLAAPWLASGWLQVSPADLHEVAIALGLMGLALGLRWPAGFYQAILYGADRQLRVSQVQIVGSLLAHGGGILVLWWGGPHIGLYFGWQIIAVGIQVFALRVFAVVRRPAWTASGWRLPDLTSLRGVQRFSMGMVALSIAGLVLTLLDKLLLSRLLPLGAFGYYMLASTVAGLTYALVTPVFHWAFPLFTREAAHDGDSLVMSYRRVNHLLACLLAPVLVLLVAGGGPLLALWTGDRAAAQVASPVLAWLTLASVLHGVTYPAHALTLARSRPQLALCLNLGLLVLAVPLITGLTRAFGAEGAGLAWAALHALYAGPGCWITHRLLMPRAARAWLLCDVGPVLALAATVAWAGRVLVPATWLGLAVSVGLSGLTLVLLALTSSRLREAARLASCRRA